MQFRKENYYKNIGVNILLNYENRLFERQGKYGDSSEEFCNKFCGELSSDSKQYEGSKETTK